MGWRIRHNKVHRSLSPGDRFRMEQGKEIGGIARELYPDGIYIYNPDLTAAAFRTEDLLRNLPSGVLFEGTFIAGDCVAKADILVKYGDSLELIEVKSGLNAKQDHIDDMAYTTIVASKSGFNPTTVSLLLLDKKYRMGMDQRFLFKKMDVTQEVFSRVDEFLPLVSTVESVSGQPREPDAGLSYNCRQCDFFSECMGKGIDAHIFEIPRLRQKNAEELIHQGIHSIHSIPGHFPLSPAQKKAVECVQCNRISIDPGLLRQLEKVQWPAHYLDFETMMIAIPPFEDIAPYDHIPIQYSIHLCDHCGHIIRHFEYMADPERDCRRELAEHLIRDLDGNGSIITYSSYEKTTISKLSSLFPDLSDTLRSLNARIIDLEKSVKCVRHPQFRGRTSIKVVLPVLVPDLSYDRLEISNGDTAMVTFACMAKGEMDQEEMERKRAALLEYCKLDTLAMVRMHEKLDKMRDIPRE
ncbi:MAG TPA: DUF2779 domain-containing protein [Methanoregulaceae archaeon]|nr:DUF2779 domain-containing protein [Methanoregulaceae archaeon]